MVIKGSGSKSICAIEVAGARIRAHGRHRFAIRLAMAIVKNHDKFLSGMKFIYP